MSGIENNTEGNIRYYFDGFSVSLTSGLSAEEKLDFLSKNNQKHIKKLNSSIQKDVINMLFYLSKDGINIEIVKSLRTFEEQNDLYNIGRQGIEGEKIVTNAKGGESFHNYGLAFDVEVYKEDGKKDWSFKGDNWKKVVEEAKRQGFEAGIDWDDPYDPPHFQNTYGKTLADLIKEYNYEIK